MGYQGMAYYKGEPYVLKSKKKFFNKKLKDGEGYLIKAMPPRKGYQEIRVYSLKNKMYLGSMIIIENTMLSKWHIGW